MTVFKELDSVFTSTIRDIQRPAAMRQLSMHSPALEVFIDFALQQPLMLEQSTTIDVARQMMKSMHSTLFLIIDSHESFQGVISLEDMVSEQVTNTNSAIPVAVERVDRGTGNDTSKRLARC